MTQITFDTLEFADTLQKAGVPREQAEAMARASQKAIGLVVEQKDLATKKDILELRMELKEEMMAMKTDLIRWMVGLVAGLGAFLVAVMAWMK